MSRLTQHLRAYAERAGRGYPDWAVRYVPLVRRLRARGWLGARRLEIGANANGLARFAPGRVIAVDISVAHLREARDAQGVLPVAASITALPFRDDAFELVVSMDTFEHIPEADRPAAAGEMVRVKDENGVAVAGFPCGARARAAEARVSAAYRGLTGAGITWLDEHEAMGLPEADEVANLFQHAAGDRTVTVTRNAWLPAWTWMWRVLMCNWPGRGNAVFQVLLRWMVPLLTRLHLRPCYRAMVWVAPKRG